VSNDPIQLIGLPANAKIGLQDLGLNLTSGHFLAWLSNPMTSFIDIGDLQGLRVSDPPWDHDEKVDRDAVRTLSFGLRNCGFCQWKIHPVSN
jgi:hypothetical protein